VSRMVPDVLPVITAAGLSGVVQRWVRKLPARVVVYLLLAPALFEPAPGVPILGAALLLSGALAALAAGLSTAGTVALLTVAGAACALLDVASRSLLQRSIPAQSLGQVFGLLEGLTMPGREADPRKAGWEVDRGSPPRSQDGCPCEGMQGAKHTIGARGHAVLPPLVYWPGPRRIAPPAAPPRPAQPARRRQTVP
jgi:hypothetical protein